MSTETPVSETGWTASASVNSSIASDGIDGSESDRWDTGTDQAAGQWFQVYFGSSQTFNEISIDSGGNITDYARGYNVEVSSNGTTFTSVATGAGWSSPETIAFPVQTASYVRVVLTEASSSYWWSITEFSVYSGTGAIPESTLGETGWVASASLNSSSASDAIDGNINDRWTTGTDSASGQWFEVDFGVAQTFNQIDMNVGGSTGDIPVSFNVQTSNDGSTFTTVASGSGNTTTAATYLTFATQTALYVRITLTAGSSSNWWSICEFTVFGATAALSYPSGIQAATSESSCTLYGGNAYCWGDDTYGELGNGITTAAAQRSPVAVYTGGSLSGVTLTQVSTGASFACGLSTAGAAYCWGLDTSGQLGNNSTTTSNVPVAVYTGGSLSGVTLTQVSTGASFACGLSTAGAAYCWGSNSSGQLGAGSSATSSSVPVAVSTSGVLSGVTLTQISVGGSLACGLSTAGAAYCWGSNSSGQLGAGSSATSSNVPVTVSGGYTFTQISAGGTSACAVTGVNTAGAAYCWGLGTSGQLGNSSYTSSTTPVLVSGSTDFGEISSGNDSTCGLSTTGQAYCWGDDTYGELGNNSVSGSDVQEAVYFSGVLSGVTVVEISSGNENTCALDSTGIAYCWGDNTWGETGNDSTAQTDVPVYVAPQAPTSVTATPGNASATVSWTAPGYLNNGTLTSYNASSSPGNGTCSSTSATTCTITGLTNGTTYTITAVTTASTGTSAPSNAATVTPSGPLALTSPASMTWTVTDNGRNQSVADAVSGDQQLTVSDATGSGAGWHITISATTLTASGGKTLPNTAAIEFNGSTSSEASIAPSATCTGSCTLPTDSTTYPVVINTLASSPPIFTIYDTAANTGEGSMIIGGSTATHPIGWWVNVPASAYAGSPSTTLTLTIVSGP